MEITDNVQVIGNLYPDNKHQSGNVYSVGGGVAPTMMSGTHGYGIGAFIEIHLLGRKEDFMKECCGNCKYNKRDFSKPQNSGYAEFCCGNEDSSEYGVPTFFDDTCDDFEEKE